MRKLLYVLIAFGFSLSHADDSMVQLGVGMTSFTSGRQVPSLQIGYETKTLGISFSSTGYRTRYDYLSGYIGSLYQIFNIGEFWGIKAKGGFGGGAYYTQRGYRETLVDETKEVTDAGIGPAFSIGIYPYDFMFVKVESLYALGSTYNLFLVFQDAAQLTIGVSF